jgi:iron complex outermembrane receptor protein
LTAKPSQNTVLRLSDLLTLTSVTAYRVYNDDAALDFDGGPWGAVAGIGILPNPYGHNVLSVDQPGIFPVVPDRTHYSSEEIRVTYAPHGLELTAGVFVQLFEEKKLYQNPAIIYTAGTPFYSNTPLHSALKDDVYSAFVDATYHITDPIAVFGGLRYTDEQLHVDYQQVRYFTPNFNPVTLQPNPASGVATALRSSEIKDNLSGRVGVRFSPNPDHSYYASYTTGYKGPATNMTSLPGQSFVLPELAQSYEIGTKHELYDHRLTMNLALYHQLTKNLQQTALVPGTITSKLINTGDIVSYGAEFDMAARISRNFRIDAGAAYTHANYTNLENSCYPGQTAAQGCVKGLQNIGGTQTDGAPRVGANVAGTYDVKMPERLPFDSYVRIGYVYTGSIQYGLSADPLLRVPKHGSLDATLGLTGRSNKWELLLYGKNLTDERYESELIAADNFISRVIGVFPRDYKRYGGILLTVNF